MASSINKNDFLYRQISRVRYAEIKNALEMFHFPYAVIKGEPLSYLAYGTFGKRYSSDIDILVSRENRQKTRLILEQHGFINKNHSRQTEIMANIYSHQMLPFCKKSKYEDIYVDINFDVFWGEFTGKRIDIDSFLQDTEDMCIYGCNIKVLPALKTIIQLILHHYKELNSIFHLMTHNCIRKEMFDDIYYMIMNNKEMISAENLYNSCFSYGMVEYAYYMLYYTELIHPDKGLDKYTKLFFTEKGSELLNYYGLSEDERKEWDIDFFTRLNNHDITEHIKNRLDKSDKDKLERNIEAFL